MPLKRATVASGVWMIPLQKPKRRFTLASCTSACSHWPMRAVAMKSSARLTVGAPARTPLALLTPEAAAMTSNFANYANGIVGSEAMMNADLTAAPEIVMPAGSPAPTTTGVMPWPGPESTRLK